MLTAPLDIRNPANFRDVAGHVRPRIPMRAHTLFRSDHLGSLNEDDARQIEALGIRRVLDFRGVDERQDYACRVPGVTVHSLAIEPTIVQKIDTLLGAGEVLGEADVVALMQDTYRGFVRHNTSRFAEFFSHLLESNEATVFHCTAGKDRTGFAAALFLYALGASHEEVMHDYLLTNERLKPLALTARRLPPEVSRVLYGVRPEFLHAAFEAIEQDHGSLEGYFREALSFGRFERDRLCELWLEPA